jgi:pilus assembly protein CpaD
MESPTMTTKTNRMRELRPLHAAMIALALAAPLQACGGADRVVTGTTPNPDYRVTHPIALAHAPITMDVFPVGGALDQRERDRVKAFGREHGETGQGQITVLLPRGGAGDTQAALADVRKALTAGGVKGSIAVGGYPVADPSLAAPIRLSFTGLKAKVASTCGEWPTDLASGSTIEGWSNRPYWNFGCANQNMLAAQVADPRDLAGPRAESESDVNMRMRAILNVRQGKDPNTDWKIKNSTIGSVGSN